jgi:hypothetical protein
MNIEQLTPEQIEAIKASGGFSGSLSAGISLHGEQATSIKPSQSIPISGYGHQLRPNVEGNRPAEGLVSAPSSEFAKRLGDQAVEEARVQAEAINKAQEEREALNPSTLLARLSYLERTVKKLEKQVQELKR